MFESLSFNNKQANNTGDRSTLTKHNPMSALNIVFSKLEQFTGDGGLDLRQWLRSFERCCVIADKDDDLVQGQILMMCIDGRAKAILDHFEAEKGSPQKYTALKAQLNAVFDSPADREAHITAFERRIQRLNESEDEFMTSLLSLYRAANPDANTEEIKRAVKRKFLQGISDNLSHNLFIFCSNPYDEKVSHQDVLKACRDAIVHLSIKQSPDPSLPASDSILMAAAAPHPPPSTDPTLDAILSLANKFEEQFRITMSKIDSQQQQINALQQQVRSILQREPHPRSQHGRFPRSRGQSRSNLRNSGSGAFEAGAPGPSPIRCYFCNGLNHLQRDSIAYKKQNSHFQQSENFWGTQ